MLRRSHSYGVLEQGLHVNTATKPLINIDELSSITKATYTEDKEYLRKYHGWRKENELLSNWYRCQITSSVFWRSIRVRRSTTTANTSTHVVPASSAFSSTKSHRKNHELPLRTRRSVAPSKLKGTLLSTKQSGPPTLHHRRKSAVYESFETRKSTTLYHPSLADTSVPSLLSPLPLLSSQEIEAVPLVIHDPPHTYSNPPPHHHPTTTIRRTSLSRPITSGVSLSRPGSSNNLQQLLQEEKFSQALTKRATQTYEMREQAVSLLYRKQGNPAGLSSSPVRTAETAQPKPPPSPFPSHLPRRRNSTLSVALEQRYLPDITSPRKNNQPPNSIEHTKPVIRKVNLSELYKLYPLETIEKYYSEKAILQRESIRYHPAVVACTKAMWKLYTRSLGVRMHKEGYMLLFGHAQRIMRNVMEAMDPTTVLFGGGNGITDTVVSGIPTTTTTLPMKNFTLEKDWGEDSEGNEYMDYPQFAFAWFQIADLWTDEVNPLVYAILLNKLYISMTRTIPSLGKKVTEPPHPLQNQDMQILLTLDTFTKDYYTAPDPDNREFAFIYQHIPRYISPEEIERFRRMKQERQALIQKKLLERKGLGSNDNDEFGPNRRNSLYSATQNLFNNDDDSWSSLSDTSNGSNLRSYPPNIREQIPSMYHFKAKNKPSFPRYHAQRISLRGMEMVINKSVHQKIDSGYVRSTDISTIIMDESIIQRISEPLYFLEQDEIACIVERTLNQTKKGIVPNNEHKTLPPPRESFISVGTVTESFQQKQYQNIEIQTTPRLFQPVRTYTGTGSLLASRNSQRTCSPTVSIVGTVNTKSLSSSNEHYRRPTSIGSTITTTTSSNGSRSNILYTSTPFRRPTELLSLASLRPITQPVVLGSSYSDLRSRTPHPGTSSSSSLFSYRTIGTAGSTSNSIFRRSLHTRDTLYRRTNDTQSNNK